MDEVVVLNKGESDELTVEKIPKCGVIITTPNSCSMFLTNEMIDFLYKNKPN